MVDFTDEEGYGRYLDLHESFMKYSNLKGISKIDYLCYLSNFDKLFEFPKDRKNNEYKRYLENLTEYLSDYLMRVRPLTDLNSVSWSFLSD
uniref:SF3A3 domain-containing protein n=1 Tax=Romanomermis culicivorax TaxID=13658 RepID=A0A915KUT8_ROMCU